MGEIIKNNPAQKYISMSKYGKLMDLSQATVKHLCETKQIDCVKCEGGTFKVREPAPTGYVSKQEYLEVVKENERLKAEKAACLSILVG